MPAQITDTDALNQIHRLLDDGNEWSSGTIEDVAQVLKRTGRAIAEPGEHTNEELIELLSDDMTNSVVRNPKYLPNLLNNGFKGFANMSHSELLKEARQAGLIDA